MVAYMRGCDGGEGRRAGCASTGLFRHWKRFLPRLYGRHGFQPVARVRWNDEYAPDDWDYGRLGRPDVVAMAVTDHAPEHVEYMDYDHACGLAAELAENEM